MKIKSLYKQYDGKQVLQDFSLELPDQGIVALMGPSGCGKTTLLSILSGVLQPDAGTLTGAGTCSMVFQEDRLLPWIDVLDNVEIVLEKEQRGRGIGSALLAEMGLAGTELEKIQNLSGGMQRRVAILRALAYDRSVLLLDEPFKGLDADLKLQVMDVIKKHSRGKLVILVTHDRQEAKLLAEELYELEGPPLAVRARSKIK